MERRTYQFRGRKVCLRKQYYRDGTLAVVMDEALTGERYGTVTVNLRSPMQDGETLAYVDTNNLEGIDAWLAAQGIARPMGIYAQSGYCSYPLMSFDPEIL